MSEYALKLSDVEIARYRWMAERARVAEADLWQRAGIAPGARIADVRMAAVRDPAAARIEACVAFGLTALAVVGAVVLTQRAGERGLAGHIDAVPAVCG